MQILDARLLIKSLKVKGSRGASSRVLAVQRVLSSPLQLQGHQAELIWNRTEIQHNGMSVLQTHSKIKSMGLSREFCDNWQRVAEMKLGRDGVLKSGGHWNWISRHFCLSNGATCVHAQLNIRIWSNPAPIRSEFPALNLPSLDISSNQQLRWVIPTK